ncbi:hypothetical protein LP43_2164 [Methylophaga thiooxydans]|uniref:DoxX family protein n=2 Tax=Methylophaga thiooxydans TaxID=392484 RepID=A0A0A0BEM3_9GAMM|nr:hypothetical protein LP43_2164 [Methylophaga thiooxydans]
MHTTRLQLSLFLLRVGVFIVMLMWTLDKLINPAHSGKVFENFYGAVGWTETVFLFIGIFELLLILAFVMGLWKRLTYGLVLLLHTISTLSALSLYMEPFKHLLFFAAWPMLAACITLYLLRNEDNFLSIKNRKGTQG